MDDAAIGRAVSGILSDLIAIPSPFPPGESAAICAYAAARLRQAGYQVEIAASKPGVDNVVARLGKGHPSLVFNAHVDTVGVGERANWRSDPFKAVERDGLIYGLGAGNCKASMAVQLWLAEQIASRGGPVRGEIVFTFVGDEENLGPDGMEFLRRSGKVKPDMLILGAQTENQLIVEERGVLWLRITTEGRAAHAGNPSIGDNAISRMMRILTVLERELGLRLSSRVEGPLRSTVNIGQLHGGHNTNVVPSSCWAEIDRRVLPGETIAQAFDEIVAIVDQVGEPKESYRVEKLTGTNGFRAPADGQAVAALAAEIQAATGAPAKFLTATGVSDGRYFADDGIEIINFGPGSGTQGHAANESVAVAEMVQAARIQLAVVGKLLGLR